ncbi:MAG: ribonuclease VapC37 [Candidatus Hydrogenedentota bacterium]
MILVDANLLIYAHVESLAQHGRAVQWLDEQLNGASPVGLPWSSLTSFLRIVTNPRVFELPEPITVAWEQICDWIACDTVWIPNPTERHVDVLGTLIASQSFLQGNHVPDAHLAALAIEHGLTLCTADSGFSRFRGLRVTNPLA